MKETSTETNVLEFAAGMRGTPKARCPHQRFDPANRLLPQSATSVHDVFTRMADLHAVKAKELKESTTRWRFSTGAGRARCEERNLTLSVELMLLRDLGRFIAGIDPEDDGNPFGSSEDY